MWTINNCSIVSTTRTYRQQPVAGSTTICWTDKSKLFRQQESKCRKVKTEVVQGGVLSSALFNCYLADFPTPPPKSSWSYTPMTLPSTHQDQIRLNKSVASTSIRRKCSTISTAKNLQFQRPNLQLNFSLQILTSTTYIHSEAGRPSNAARKKAKCVRSDARHPSHFRTTLQQYRSKSAATQ